jgi:F-type H+-transporting ATPase subunit epsilon
VSDDTLHVELVAADRLVWSGEATVVNARTAGGEIGILANHMPVLSLMTPGVVEVVPADGERWKAAVDSGILSVAANRVSILAEHAELADDIDVDAARSDLEDADSAADKGDDEDERETGPDPEAVRAWAEARLRAAEASN